MQKTIDYYNTNAKQFAETTAFVKFHNMQRKFLEKLPKGSVILDFGCGSGRDTKYFMEQGYRVEAIDGSVELCRLASEYTGIEVKHMYFQELSELDKYDGIWACSSILHLPVGELEDVLKKMEAALKGKLEPTYEEKILGQAEVRRLFKFSKVGTIAGCYVTDGVIERNSLVRILRNGVVIFEGKMASLKRFKDDAKEVKQGYECGITIDGYNDIKEGDVFETYEMVEVKR